jgi:signal transduction histidine kinase
MEVSAKLLESLVDALPMGAVIWRVEDPVDGGKLRMVRPNRGASKASGADLRQFIGMTMAEAFPPFVASGLPDKMLEVAFHGGEHFDIGLVPYQDDKLQHGVFAVSAYRLDDEHLVVQYRNVTEQERLLAELALANEELKRFAHLASHDLQAPVRRVLAFCEIVRDKAELDEQNRSYLNFAISESGRMLELIRALLAYAQASQGPLDVQPLAVSDMFERVHSDLQGLVDSSGARIQADHGDLVLLAPDRLGEQVLFNLVGNGLKFTRPGVAPEIGLKATLDGEFVRIDVSDNGVGFDPEKSAAIFEPFRRLVTTSQFQGTGVGLALCKSVTERSGGRIEVDSTPGEGSVFSVWFPLAPSA